MTIVAQSHACDWREPCPQMFRPGAAACAAGKVKVEQVSEVEEGGETAFTRLDIAVKPKRGRALLWPSVLDADLLKSDMRTMHEARPVIRGVKYAANAWLHLYDFRGPHGRGCAP